MNSKGSRNWEIRGSDETLQKGIQDINETDRAKIEADKKVGLAPWEVKMMEADAAREEKLKRVEAEREAKLKSLDNRREERQLEKDENLKTLELNSEEKLKALEYSREEKMKTLEDRREDKLKTLECNREVTMAAVGALQETRIKELEAAKDIRLKELELGVEKHYETQAQIIGTIKEMYRTDHLERMEALKLKSSYLKEAGQNQPTINNSFFDIGAKDDHGLNTTGGGMAWTEGQLGITNHAEITGLAQTSPPGIGRIGGGNGGSGASPLKFSSGYEAGGNRRAIGYKPDHREYSSGYGSESARSSFSGFPKQTKSECSDEDGLTIDIDTDIEKLQLENQNKKSQFELKKLELEIMNLEMERQRKEN